MLIKRFLGFIACLSIFSLTVKAQQSETTIPQILEGVSEGRLSITEAHDRMHQFYYNGEIHKCVTPLHIFENKYKNELQGRLTNPSPREANSLATETYVSPSGKFEFTYETTGSHAVPLDDANMNMVPDYVEWTAEAADESYDYLVSQLGYTDPIPFGSMYEVSFQESGFYGFTGTYSNPGGPGTFIVIENDFDGFPQNDDPSGDQRGAVKVTMAHEFKHAIQYAQNNWSGEADSWAEMDATLVEETVYDEVNDYYNYLGGSGDVFRSPTRTVIPGSYEDITWALFFHEKYGEDFWPNAWDRIENSVSDLPLLDAVSEELTFQSIDYTESLLELYTWHFVSGVYNSSLFGFEESQFYPSPNVQQTITEITDEFSLDINVGRFASYFLNVEPPANKLGDASVLLASESEDISLAVVAYFKNGSVEFEIATLESGFLVVSNGWSWDEINRLGAIVLNENRIQTQTFQIRVSDSYTKIPLLNNDKPNVTEIAQNYPNPFNPSTTIPVSISELQKVKVDIYDITGRFVQTVYDGNLARGNYALPVNFQGYASGVYLYRLQTNDKVQVKRMMFIK